MVGRDHKHDTSLRTEQKFAVALDAEDYSAVAGLLAPDCEYVATRATFIGPEEIIGSYRKVAAWMKASVDKVSYRHSVRPGAEGKAIVTFVDDVTRSRLRHVYSCEQELSFDAEGRIRRIVHVDLPGERDAADPFLRKVGVQR